MGCLAPVAGLSGQEASAKASTDNPWFVEIAADSGLDFVHHNGMTGQYYFHEMMGAGVALLDYDNDGDLDIYAVQGHSLERGAAADPAMKDRTVRESHAVRFRRLRPDALRRCDGRQRTRGARLRHGASRWVTSTMTAGWTSTWPTSRPTSCGAIEARNASGQVTFEDVSAAYKVNDRGWGVSASMVDFDRDGWLDLYVTNYVAFAVAVHKPCRNYVGAVDYCSPLAYSAQPDRLWRNLGAGQGGARHFGGFQDVSVALGLDKAFGAGLGVVSGDLDGDGLADLYVG